MSKPKSKPKNRKKNDILVQPDSVRFSIFGYKVPSLMQPAAFKSPSSAVAGRRLAGPGSPAALLAFVAFVVSVG
jgi:hypothetical protein